MPLVSSYAREKKIEKLFSLMKPEDQILEVGCGDGWLVERARRAGYHHVYGLDLKGPADYVGDIRDWRQIGIKPASFDFIIGLEVIEHADCFSEMHDMLKPGGRIFLTSPVPHWDWACRAMELMGLAQQRTSPHDHLIYFEKIPLFKPLEITRFGMLSQWGVFQKSW